MFNLTRHLELSLYKLSECKELTTNPDNTQCYWQECGATGTHTLGVGMKNGTAILEGSLSVSYKDKYALSIWLSNPTAQHLPK